MANCKTELHWHIVMNGRYDWRGTGGIKTSGRGRLRRCSGIKTANAKAVRSASNQARKIDSGSLAWPRALRYKGAIEFRLLSSF